MSGESKEKLAIYVIDEKFRIVHLDQDLEQTSSQPKRGQYCYEVFSHQSSQCKKCPLREENQGQSILYNHMLEEWVRVNATALDIPGGEKYHVIVAESLEREEQPDGQYVPDNELGGGLYTKNGFFQAVENMLADQQKAAGWCMLSIDIENFKLFNEWHGWEEGNRLISEIAGCLKRQTEHNSGIAGYFGDDDFVLLTPYDETVIDGLYREIAALPKVSHDRLGFLPAFGICMVTEKPESAATLYDYAELARASVRENYNIRIRKFDGKMLEQIEYQYVLLSDIKKALEEGEITFYLQPKCNMENGKVIGAEALVRWISKEKGVVAPGVFIPILEKTGYICKLDVYVWESVCRWLRSLLDRGIQPVPVSVNVSRADIFFTDVPAFFNEMIKKYNLDPKLIEIEITESVYVEDNSFINDVVMKLRKAGFCVLMDDFGSGYSSLNMLKDVEVDVLKIDMRFLGINEENAHKGISILEAVHNMAHLIGIKIIAEGVETEEQKDFLLKMGCGYGQGYYFYRPLPVIDFEQVMENKDNLDFEEYRDKRIEHLYLKDLLSEDMFSEVMINNMLGAVAFYDVYEEEITVRRYNQHYASLVGNPTFQADTKLNFQEHFYLEDYGMIFKMFDDARKNRNEGAECDIRRRRPDGTDLWMHMRTFFLREQNGHAVYYSSLSDATDIYRKNRILSRQNKVLDFLNNDMPGGYYCHENSEDYDFLHISRRFLDLVGYTKEEIQLKFQNKFRNMIHPDDWEFVHRGLMNLEQTGGNCSLPYRIRCKNGYISIYDLGRLVKYDDHEFFQGIILCDMDYYRQVQDMEYDENAESVYSSTMMPCGIFQSQADGGHEFSYVSNSMLAMLGYSRADFMKKFKNSTDNMVWEEDRERVSREVDEQVRCGNYVSLEYRIEMADGSLKWVYSRGRLTIDSEGKRWFYCSITDYDYLKEKYREKEWQQMKYKSLAEIPGTIVYDYDPFIDRFTMEIALEDGGMETVITDRFVADIEHHPWLSTEKVEEQKAVLQEASLVPMSGTTEFKGRFVWDREAHWYRSHFTSLADEDGIVYRIVGRADNIDDEKRTISDLQDRARRDSMTQLLNGQFAKENLGEAIEKFHGGTLFLLEVEAMREINDSLGREQGDMVLKKTAEIVGLTFQKEHIQSRFGGDVFLVFMPGIFDREVAALKAQELLRKTEDIGLEGGRHPHCNVGIAIAGNKLCTVDTLIHQADMALYRAKCDGKNSYRFFED